MPRLVAPVALGLFLLLIALAMPTLIASSGGDATITQETAEGDTTNITEGLRMETDKVTSNSSTMTLRDTNTGDSQTEQIANGTNTTYSLTGGNVTIAVTNIESNSVATSEVTYPRTYGWVDPAVRFVQNFDILLAIVAFVMIAGAIGALTIQ